MRDSRHLNSVAPALPPAPPSPKTKTPVLLPSSLRRLVGVDCEEGPISIPARPFLVPDPKPSKRTVPGWLVASVVFYMLFDIAVYEFLKVDIDGGFLRALLFWLGKAVR